LLPRLLKSLTTQDYPQMPHTKVYLADAGSTDGTQQLAAGFAGLLDISVIPGGLPSIGRNLGARRAESRYVLFIDADMELADPTLIRRTVERAIRKGLHCVTTNIWCDDGSFADNALYFGNNVVQHLSALVKPFATGMFMLFEKQRFDELGGFDERALYAEDYLLTKKVTLGRFGVVSGKVLTTNRRFRKLGHARIAFMFFKTALNSWNDSYFHRDQHYWDSKVQ
jgi:glycosyltransferase involved in cell wall biosynthesis